MSLENSENPNEKIVFENIWNLKKWVININDKKIEVKIFYINWVEVLPHYMVFEKTKSIENTLFKFLNILAGNLNYYKNSWQKNLQAQFVARCEMYQLVRKYIFETYPNLITKENKNLVELTNETILKYKKLKKEI